MTRKEQLKADLLQNFSDFQGIKYPGGSKEANSIVAEGLAESIDRAIDDGIDLTFKGILRCSEINLLTDKKSGDLYTCSDAGVLNGSVQLPVTKTSVVLWTGDRFKLFLVVPEQVTPGSQISIDGFFSQTSRNPVENRLVTAALAATINAINLHVQNQENPHGVTAAQVGADQEGTAETLVSNHNSDESAHADIRQLIEDEADERTDADTALQQQIDAIVSKSDVVAIVGTYVDLLALDTSTIFDNDIVKVLSDESRQGKKTYYSWDIASEAWTYIGSEAETYTKSEVNSLLNSKANKVSGATNGHLAGLDANGNLTDSGVSPSDISSGIFIAEYGTTTIAQIEAAYNANKAMLVKMGGGNPGIALFTTRYTLNGAHSYWFYRKYGRDYGANEDQHYAYVYIDSSGWNDYSFTSPKNRHSSTTDEYGEGSETHYGHVQLTESVTQNSKKAVTSGAVYTALGGKAPTSHAVNSTTYGEGSEMNYGHVQLTSSVTQNSKKAVTSGAVYTALQNLPQPAPEIFVAEYGRTSWDDIYIAVTSGKTVICRFSNPDFSPFGSVYLHSLGGNDESYVFSFAALVGGYYITASVHDQSGMWDFGWSKNLGSLLFNIDPSGSESNYVTEKGTIKPIPPSAYQAITKDADYTTQTSTVVTLQQTNRLYKIYVEPSIYPFGDVYLHVSSGLTGVVFLDLKVGFSVGGCGSHYYTANYLKWTDIFGVEQKMRILPDLYDGQRMTVIPVDKTYFRLKVECYNGEIMAVTSLGDIHLETSGLVAKSVTSNKIATAAVTNDKIGLGAVGTAELANSAVTRDKIAFGAVSADKQACGYFDWTIDTHYNGGPRKYIDLSGSNGSSGSDGSPNSLYTAIAYDSSTVRYTNVMIRFNVTYSSATPFVYCSLNSLPKFTLFRLKLCAVGHGLKIRFRTNSTTEALSLAVINNNTYTNESRDYTLDANVKEDVVFFRGNDDNGKCTLYLISNWTA